MMSDRFATVQDDYIYGIFGISQGGAPRQGQYNIGWFSMLDKLKEGGLITDRLLASPTAAIVLGAVFEWVESEHSKDRVLNIHGMACRLVRGRIRFPDPPGLIRFTEDRMSVTQVMLCAGVCSTEETVVLKFLGDIGGGSVYRQDGYVLELHQWIELIN
ncbi:hypothetical protein LA080_007158 [Diaporthe eres]|nr:hypothetical protein LA080_007158 [Diaporthe eres]